MDGSGGETTPGLTALRQKIAEDFARLNHPPAAWIPPRTDDEGRPVADVAIVGGGMCGLAAAFALRRLGIANIRHVDRRPAGLEGPWLTYARMETLRSPKHLTGPAQGLPSLTFRAWWEAQGRDWETLDRIARPDWMAYLAWYRAVTGAQIENDVALREIVPGDDGVTLVLDRADGSERLTARRVVLATGREGQATPRVPAPFRPWLGGSVRHSSDAVAPEELAGRQVAVIGLAASAFDNAAMALEAGAARVTLIGRANAIPRLNKMKQTVYPGFTHGFPHLPDAEKMRLLDHVLSFRIAPPRRSVQRVSSDPRIDLMLGTEVIGAAEDAGVLTLQTNKGSVSADLVILGTGFSIDVAAPAETASFADDILLWRDRVPEAAGEWGAHPYLSPDFSFRSRSGLDRLGRIHCLTHAATLSLGNLANDIPAVSEGAVRLAEGIAASLFVEDRATHWQRLQDYADPELMGDEWPGVTAWSPAV